jgi:predicted O-methyltransferase YrrM
MNPSTGSDSFDAVWPMIAAIDGWLSQEQARALHAASATVDSGAWIVEIGSHEGRSTAALALGRSAPAPLLAVDPYPPQSRGGGDATLAAFLENMRRLGFDEDVQLFRGTSNDAARNLALLCEVAAAERPVRLAGSGETAGPLPIAITPAIGLLFVDGLHDRNSVLHDINAWEPHIAPGGLAFFHDAFFRLGVTLALLQRHLLNFEFRYLGSVGNLAMFQRVHDVGNREALADSLRLLGRLSYFVRNLITTLGVRRGWGPLLRAFPPEEDFEY